MNLGEPHLVALKGLRVAFYTDNGILTPTPETGEVVKRVAGLLSNAGAHVEEARPECLEQTYDIWWGLSSADRGAGVEAILKAAGTTEVDRYMKCFQEAQLAAPAMGPADFGALMVKWDSFCATMTRFIENFDAIICPVVAFPAQPHGFILEKDKDLGFSYCFTYNPHRLACGRCSWRNIA